VADQIIELLRSRIAAGTYPRGGRLPTERELAEEFGVSGPTIREAMRALTTSGLLEIRHGSGAYVAASPGALMASPLATLVQVEQVRLLDVLRLLGALDAHAVELAATRATDEDLARLRRATEAVAESSSLDEIGIAMNGFFGALGAAAREPLTVALMTFLGRLVTGLELSGYRPRSARFWAEWTRALQPRRLAVVEALERRDADAALAATRELHAAVEERIDMTPRLRDLRLSDPKLAGFVSTLIGEHGRT
jgi:GntR family transcriptional repressor for pyruvate dehydrogenase complex